MTGRDTIDGGNGPDRIDELLTLAALGELTAAEEAELDAALTADVGAAADLDADLEVAAALQATLAEGPPPTLKSNVMAAIDALDESGQSGDPVGPVEATAPPSPSSETGSVVDFSAAQHARVERRSRGWQPLLAAAAVVMLLVGGVLIANRGGDDGATYDAIAQADDGSNVHSSATSPERSTWSTHRADRRSCSPGPTSRY